MLILILFAAKFKVFNPNFLSFCHNLIERSILNLREFSMVSYLSAIFFYGHINSIADSIYQFLITELNLRRKILITATGKYRRCRTSIEESFRGSIRIHLHLQISNNIYNRIDDSVCLIGQIRCDGSNFISIFIAHFGRLILTVSNKQNTKSKQGNFTPELRELGSQHIPALSPRDITNTINILSLTNIFFTQLPSDRSSINYDAIIHFLSLRLTQLCENFLSISPTQDWNCANTSQSISALFKVQEQRTRQLATESGFTSFRLTVNQQKLTFKISANLRRFQTKNINISHLIHSFCTRLGASQFLRPSPLSYRRQSSDRLCFNHSYHRCWPTITPTHTSSHRYDCYYRPQGPSREHQSASAQSQPYEH